jgi:S1-C subfamily serine protease
MKLYSRRQLLTLCAIVGVSALAVGTAVTWKILSSRDFGRTGGVQVHALQTAQDVPIKATPAQYDAVPSLKASGPTDDELNSIEIYEKANKAVVHITSVTIEYDWYMQAMPQEGTGSGVIIDQDGHVLTNYHVVKDAKQLNITLADGAELDGKIVGTDPQNDLAVVQFIPKTKPLTTVPFGTSSNLRVGQKVLAIGNPFAFDRTLTTGVVSGLGRPLQTDDGYVIREMIQTDAAINPGNSGGPLLNSRGELIGINTAIYSPSGASAGVGFAIPINIAKRVAEELIKFGVVKRGWMDIDWVALEPRIVRYFRLPVQSGILVSVARTNASQAGIRGGDQASAVRYGSKVIYGNGDVITEVNGVKVASFSDYTGALEATRPDQLIDVKVLRGSQEKTMKVKLTEKPADRSY